MRKRQPMQNRPPLAAPLKRDYIFTEHALERMKRRGLPEETVRAVLAAPEERLDVRPGRMMFQAKVTMDAPARTFVVRYRGCES